MTLKREISLQSSGLGTRHFNNWKITKWKMNKAHGGTVEKPAAVGALGSHRGTHRLGRWAALLRGLRVRLNRKGLGKYSRGTSTNQGHRGNCEQINWERTENFLVQICIKQLGNAGTDFCDFL